MLIPASPKIPQGTKCANTLNLYTTHIHERDLHMVYQDYKSDFKVLMTKDKTITIHQRNPKYVAFEVYKV